VNSAFL